MLREIEETNQKRGEPRKRWFTDSSMDLFVWFNDDGEIVSYHLTYNKPSDEKALTWSEEHGFSHFGVDDGARPGKHPASPLLVDDGVFKPTKIIAMLKESSDVLESSIVDFIISGIEEHFK